MDLESIETAERFSKMTAEHFNGGYFSEAVKDKYSEIKDLDQDQKEKLFEDTFNHAWQLAHEIKAHESYKRGKVDLSDHGLGVISIKAEAASKGKTQMEQFKYPSGYRSLRIGVLAFDPVSHAHVERDTDYPGHKYNLVHEKNHPDYWKDSGTTILLGNDGKPGTNYFVDLDTNIKLALDQVETLEVVENKLDQEVQSASS